MAQTKKPKKPVSTRKTTAARPKKAASAKRSTTVRRQKASRDMKSFRVATETQPFMSVRLTRQTVYWLILSIAVLALGLWVLNINNQVQQMYDTIEQNQVRLDELDAKHIEALKKSKTSQRY